MKNKKINLSSVYCILNIYTNKRYVGSTTNFSDRKGCHLYDLRHERHSSKLLQSEYNEYGEGSLKFFKLEEVETFQLDELISREQFWIDFYNPEYNVNMIAGYRFPKHTNESKEKIRNRMLGRKQSQEEKDKRASAIRKFWKTHPAKIIPQAIREHLSKINIGKKNPNWGRKRTPEQLKNMSEGRSNVFYTFKSPDGEMITFRNLSKAQIGIPYGALRNLYRGITKSYKGWTFIKSERVQ